ncbi:sugar ABC transporter permease [Prosthecobacter sp.]|uniref:sugar ABC transporter permease n=1 Tax=Prosthecobacter sp. TaxID=1965333 RepID=UPI003784D91F
MNLRFRELPIVIALLAVCMFFAVKEPAFLGARNLSMLVTELSITATLAMGMLLVLLPGHIDLSAGSGVGLLGGIGSVLVMHQHLPAPAALGLGFLCGVLIWMAMGAFIVCERMPSFIVTLGAMLIFKGLFWRVINNSTVPVVPGGQSNLYSLLTTYYLPANYGWVLAAVLVLALILTTLSARRQRMAHGFAVESREMAFLRLFIAAQAVALFVLVTGQFRGIPLPSLILGGVMLIVYALTQHTALGRHLYAIGGSAEAALVSGVPMKRSVIAAYGCMGAIVAITGFMQTAYAGSSTTTVGDLMELDAVAACVIGGVNLRGGRGTVLGVLLGALIIACLLNGMQLMSVENDKKFIARGVVLILAVWMDMRLSRKS